MSDRDQWFNRAMGAEDAARSYQSVSQERLKTIVRLWELIEIQRGRIEALRMALAHYAAARHWGFPGPDYPDYLGHAPVLWLAESNPNEIALNVLGWPHKDRYPETAEEALRATSVPTNVSTPADNQPTDREPGPI